MATGFRGVVYDLGLSATQRDFVQRRFPGCQLHTYFGPFPDHMRVRRALAPCTEPFENGTPCIRLGAGVPLTHAE